MNQNGNLGESYDFKYELKKDPPANMSLDLILRSGEIANESQDDENISLSLWMSERHTQSV